MSQNQKKRIETAGEGPKYHYFRVNPMKANRTDKLNF